MPATKEAIALAHKIRKLFKEGDDKRDKGLPLTLPEVERLDNLAYGPLNPDHLLDIYLPKDRSAPVPLIINIHGGGWVYGTKETYQFYGMSLAKEGFAFVNINYRLAPTVEFPEALNDINRAIHWVAENGKDYHLDTNNAFIVGDSAGGQMALQYLAILANDDFRALFGYDRPKLVVRAAAINCGSAFLYLPEAISGLPTAYFTETSVAKYGDLLKTELYLNKAVPPLYLMTANEDFLRDTTCRLSGYLLAKDIFHELHIYGSAEDPKGHVFHCDVRDPVGKECNLNQLAFFRRYLAD